VMVLAAGAMMQMKPGQQMTAAAIKPRMSRCLEIDLAR
jgi:hypothetical protein